MRSLLDVNVLIALFDPDHVQHRSATQWLSQNGNEGWASCPITQNGLLRIMSQPRYPNPIPLPQLMSRLRAATETEHHEFIAAGISLLDTACIDQTVVLTAKQLTDTYLLALAVQHGCRLVTFDRSIPSNAVIGAEANSLVVL